MAGNPPVDVQEFGQSIWYDNISRRLIQNGTIEKLITEDGVVGITSNPSIFEKAIAESVIYDNTIATLLDMEIPQIFDHLAIEDIQAGADLLRPVYDRTNKGDGYISLEVSPLIANDTETTLSEAKRLFKEVDRPNVMIKIPATDAGLPAIEEAIYSGVNVNITLIFSVKNYIEVAKAYIRGLERRLQEGKDVDSIASVASFFLSRIDSMVDQQLESNILAAQGRDLDRVSANRRLLGKTAIANAKQAYLEFKKLFEGETFAELREAGAMVQRPLWASTSTKNPAYPDTMYVDELIGPHTVNTVPHETLYAFKDHGKVGPTLEQDIDEAGDVLDMLAEVGVDIDRVTHMLQVDGVEKFAKSFEELMKAIEGKVKMLKAGVIQRQSGVVGAYEPAIREEMEDMKDAPKNIWNKNAGWWKTDGDHKAVISNRLGWLTVVSDGRIDRERLQKLQNETKNAGLQHVVLLGMGGSSLAPEVLQTTFGNADGFPELIVLDSTVPERVNDVANAINIEQTMFIVASKSGGTLETRSFFDYFYAKAVEQLGKDAAGRLFIVITDPGSALVDIGNERGVAHIFENPSDIGGRYSALSYFGLVPAAMIGLDMDRLYKSAERIEHAIGLEVPATGNPALWLGVIIGVISDSGRDKVSIISSPEISSFGAWAEQLIAESTGKENEGVVPIVGATVGNPHDYDDDRLFIFLRLDNTDAELDDKVKALWEAGQPVFTIQLQDEYDLGGEFLRWEFATAVIGQMLAINPFDEPNVASAKKNTDELLGIYQKQGKFPTSDPAVVEGDVALYAGERTSEILNRICMQRNYNSSNLAGLLAAHIGLARSGEYISLLAYLNPDDETHETLEEIRRRLRHTTQRAVTVGYGPRYLHSTGQLHKGGPNTGVFIIITADDKVDLDIPNQPYSFGTLKMAQALGDLRSLQENRRRVVHLHISGDGQDGLAKISEAIAAAEEKQI